MHTTDEEVRRLLQDAWSRTGPKPGPRKGRTDLDALRSEIVPGHVDEGRDTLMDLVGDAHLVLLGEASHGTHDVYSQYRRPGLPARGTW